jgi:hypothetical protein
VVQHQQQPPKKKTKKATFTKTKHCVTPALPHEPDVKPDAVDVVGIIPGDVYVDPELTEGHAGYEESGNSEISQHL